MGGCKSRKDDDSKDALSLKATADHEQSSLLCDEASTEEGWADYIGKPLEVGEAARGIWNGIFGEQEDTDLIRGSSSEEVSEDPVELGQSAAMEIDAILATGMFDWYVSDADAMAVLEIFAMLEGETLKIAVAFTDTTAISCLMDNMPAEGLSSPGFTNLSKHLTLSHLKTQRDQEANSSYTEDEINERTNAMESEMLQTAIADKDEVRIKSILRSFPEAAALTDNQKQLLTNLFYNYETRTIWELSFQIRFGLKTEGNQIMLAAYGDRKTDWSREALTRSWEVLSALPASHVGDNDKLASFVRVEDSDRDERREEGKSVGTGGWYSEKKETVAMYVGDDLDKKNHGAADEDDVLYDVTRFDKVVRHEIGHAVDAQLGFMESRGSEEKFGGWQEHEADCELILEKAVAAFGLPVVDEDEDLAINTTDDYRKQVLLALESATKDRSYASFHSVIDELADIELSSHPIVANLRNGIAGDPWYDGTYGMLVGGRRYFLSYKNQWCSYSDGTYGNKVSKYQYRAPAEWFAEAYAAYYDPASNGQGELLLKANKAAKEDFDTTVHGQ